MSAGLTNDIHAATECQEFAASASAGQTAISGDTSVLKTIGSGVTKKDLYPTAFVAQVGGLLVLENEDGASSRRDITVVAGVLYPIQGIAGKPITTIDGANTTADNICFLYVA